MYCDPIPVMSVVMCTLLSVDDFVNDSEHCYFSSSVMNFILKAAIGVRVFKKSMLMNSLLHYLTCTFKVNPMLMHLFAPDLELS